MALCDVRVVDLSCFACVCVCARGASWSARVGDPQILLKCTNTCKKHVRLESLQRIPGARLSIRLRWSVAQQVWKRSAAKKFVDDALDSRRECCGEV